MNAPLRHSRPLFNDLESCLLWAFRLAPLYAQMSTPRGAARWEKDDHREQIDTPYGAVRAWQELAGKPMGADAGGQAGMIQSYVRALPYDEQCHLYAKYLNGEMRQNGKDFLARFCREQFGKDIDLRAVYELVGKFYGLKVSVSQLAKRCGATRYRMIALEREIYITLDALSVRTERKVYDRFERDGLLAKGYA